MLDVTLRLKVIYDFGRHELVHELVLRGDYIVEKRWLVE